MNCAKSGCSRNVSTRRCAASAISAVNPSRKGCHRVGLPTINSWVCCRPSCPVNHGRVSLVHVPIGMVRSRQRRPISTSSRRTGQVRNGRVGSGVRPNGLARLSPWLSHSRWPASLGDPAVLYDNGEKRTMRRFNAVSVQRARWASCSSAPHGVTITTAAPDIGANAGPSTSTRCTSPPGDRYTLSASGV